MGGGQGETTEARLRWQLDVNAYRIRRHTVAYSCTVHRTCTPREPACCDIVHDPDLALFDKFVGVRAINKAIYGMLAPGVIMFVGHLLVSTLRRRQLHDRAEPPALGHHAALDDE